MKVREKEQARELRRSGKSVKEITKILGVAKSSVSVWVKDIALTDEQKTQLLERMRMKGSYDARVAGSKEHCRRLREIRRRWQEEGRKQAQKKDPTHMAGCMLYWAEGSKLNNRNQVDMSNSNPYMLLLFLKFLRSFFHVKNSKVTFAINHYDDLVSLREAEKYWMRFLGLNQSNKRSATVNNLSRYSHKKRAGFLKYGTCTLRVNSTEVLQKIYGAIQEYGGFTDPAWLG